MTNTTTRWQLRGSCRSEDPDLFFPLGTTGPALAQAEEAKYVCRRCPVMEQCQEWALDNRVDEGIWGGLDENQRRSILRHRSRGTTPTYPRKPLPAFDTYREAYDFMTLAVDGHIEWTGTTDVRVGGDRIRRNQVAWHVLHGRPPAGRVYPDCDHDGCVQHLTDQTTRNARARGRTTDMPVAA